MRIISQELRAWEQEEYGDLRDLEVEGICCWFCGEQIGGTDYAETTMDVDGMAMWVPVCDHCDPPPPPPEPPTPIAGRLACPVCSETLVPPRRHSCGGAVCTSAMTGTSAETFQLLSSARRY